MDVGYWIEEINPDPRFPTVKLRWWKLFDGPIEHYIESDLFRVTDDEGNEYTSINDGDK